MVSSVFGVPVNVWVSSFFDVPVIVWFRQFLAYAVNLWRSFSRTCERMGFVSSVSSVFGVPVNVRISSVSDVPVIVWFRQFLA